MLLSLLALGGAIATFYLTRHIDDEVVKLVGRLVGVVCSLMSLLFAPWLLKLSIAVAVLLLSDRSSSLESE